MGIWFLFLLALAGLVAWLGSRTADVEAGVTAPMLAPSVDVASGARGPRDARASASPAVPAPEAPALDRDKK